eukprot:3698166-Pyramimonas_sp.AAC.2
MASAGASSATTDEYSCRPEAETEYWGDVVQWGHPQPVAEACCNACRSYEPTVDVLKGTRVLLYISRECSYTHHASPLMQCTS